MNFHEFGDAAAPHIMLIHGGGNAWWNYLRQARALCNMCAGEATMCYHLLPLKENRPLLDNVMYLGLPQSILRIGESQKDKRRNRHERPL